MLTQENMPDYGTKTIPLEYYTMTPYDSSFKGLHILFEKAMLTIPWENIFRFGYKQLRIAETEKFPHVTFSFPWTRS